MIRCVSCLVKINKLFIVAVPRLPPCLNSVHGEVCPTLPFNKVPSAVNVIKFISVFKWADNFVRLSIKYRHRIVYRLILEIHVFRSILDVQNILGLPVHILLHRVQRGEFDHLSEIAPTGVCLAQA